MAKKASDISGWVFIGIGFIVIAVSIFFYNTLKFFIVIGGIMTLYGLGKLAYDKVERQFKTNDKEWEPVDLNKAKNPYIEKMEQEKRNAQQAAQTKQQRPMMQQAVQQTHHPQQHMQQRQGVHMQQRPIIHQQSHPQMQQHRASAQQRTQHPQQQQIQQRPAHQMSGRYCSSCGSQIAPHHRFCTQCGARTT